MGSPGGPARFGGTTQQLITAEADVDVKASEGITPLHVAVLNDRHAAIAMLLQARADATIQNLTGDTALHLAAKHGFLQCTELLLKCPGCTDLRNGAWFTPEDVARQANHSLIAQMIQDRRQASLREQTDLAEEVA